MICARGRAPGPYGPGYQLARSSGPRTFRALRGRRFRTSEGKHSLDSVSAGAKAIIHVHARGPNLLTECQRSGGPRQTRSPARKGRVGVHAMDRV